MAYDTVCIMNKVGDSKRGSINSENKELLSTEMAARTARVSYITLRRWLASGDFQNWLADERKEPLTSVKLSNGKHVWQFSIQNRRDLIEYRDLPERRQRGATGRPRAEVRRERNHKRWMTRVGIRKVSQDEQQRNRVLRRYYKVLVELINKGVAPRDLRLGPVTRQLIPESTIEQFAAVHLNSCDLNDEGQSLLAKITPSLSNSRIWSEWANEVE